MFIIGVSISSSTSCYDVKQVVGLGIEVHDRREPLVFVWRLFCFPQVRRGSLFYFCLGWFERRGRRVFVVGLTY